MFLLTPNQYYYFTFVNVKLLLCWGAEPGKKDFNGNTASDIAQNRKQTEVSIWLRHTRAFGSKGVYTYNDTKKEKALKVPTLFLTYYHSFISSFCSYVGSITAFRKGEQKWNALLKKVVVLFNIEVSKKKQKTIP